MATKVAREKATSNLIDNLLSQVTFIEPPGENFYCLLCRNILRYPTQLSCGHRVCRTCEGTSIYTNKGTMVCPLDGILDEKSFPDTSALTEIMHLSVSCISRDHGCIWEGLLHQLEEHLMESELSIEFECPFHQFQCMFKSTRMRMKRHLQDECKQHDVLLMIAFRELLDTSKGNREQLNAIQLQTRDIERALVMIKDESLNLQTMLLQTDEVLREHEMISDQINEDLRQFDALVQSSEDKKTKFLAFHEKYKEVVKTVEEQMNYAMESQSETNTGLLTTQKTLIDKVKRLTDISKTNDKQTNDLAIRIRIHQCTSYDGRYIWKLDNIRSRFTAALSGKADELYTPPLHTSPYGYKYSAKVMLYGGVKGHETKMADKSKMVDNNVKHLSFYIALMQGDYDEILQFPFPYPITITLLNASKNPDIVQTLYPDPNKAHFQKPYKNLNPAIGFSRFCSHDRLFSEGFVKNDALYFEIVVNKTDNNVKEPNI